MAGNILIVDDETSFRAILASILRSADYTCREAGDGLQALALLDSGEDFELVISKLMMADDGAELLGRIKKKYPLIPMVVFSSVRDVPLARTAIRNGAYDYLLKPFETQQLLTIVRRALADRGQNLAGTEPMRKSLSQRERSYDVTLEALGNALALKDAGTEAHCKRVTGYTICIARAMGIPKEQIPALARGAYLHDLGMITIPDAILRKPGYLNPDEFAIIKEHCVRGYQMVCKIPSLADAAEIVYSHHERYDGTGYPRGLKRTEIPLGARIVAVANTLDAITSGRPYHLAQSLVAARTEIHAWSGRQFDTEIVSIFLQIPENLWSDVRNEIAAETYNKSS
jgi:response regulator RpfG family c-di-GMP phosphodiesterase